MAQKGQPTAHPTWLLTQTVDRRREVSACGCLHGHSLDRLSVPQPAEELDRLPGVGEHLGVDGDAREVEFRRQRAPQCRGELKHALEVAHEGLPGRVLELARAPPRLAVARERIDQRRLTGGAEGSGGHDSMVRASTAAAADHVGCPG